MIRDQAATPGSISGRQNAAGSGAPRPGTAAIILAQAWVPSSICRFQRSKSSWPAALGSIRVSLPSYRSADDALRQAGSGATGEPVGDLRPAVGRRATAGDQRDVPAGKLDVFRVAAADVLEQGL